MVSSYLNTMALLIDDGPQRNKVHSGINLKSDDSSKVENFT